MLLYKVTALACAVVAVMAYPPHHGRAPVYYDSSFDHVKEDYQHEPQPYDFGYETKDEYGGTQNRQESGDGHGGVKGTYGYTDPHGIYRQVDYVADEHGFRAKVRTNEPGTANQNPAAVGVHADPPAPHYKPPVHAEEDHYY